MIDPLTREPIGDPDVLYETFYAHTRHLRPSRHAELPSTAGARVNYDAIFANGVCVICQQPRTPDGYEAHAAHHLATCEAITDTYQGVTRAIPTPAAEQEKLPVSFKRKLDPVLKKLVAKANRKARSA